MEQSRPSACVPSHTMGSTCAWGTSDLVSKWEQMCVESCTSGLLHSQTRGVNIFVSTLLKSIYIQLDNCPFWSPLASGCTQHLTAFTTPTESPCHNSSPMAVLLVFSSVQDPFGNGGPYHDHLPQCDCFLLAPTGPLSPPQVHLWILT